MLDHMTNIAYGYKDAFYELYRLTRMACTVPMKTASAECLFSGCSLKRIETYLSTTTSDERFNSSGDAVDSLESRDEQEILTYEQVLDIYDVH